MSKKKADKNFPRELRESAHKIWLAGLGALAAAEEEGTKVFSSLIERGEAFESRGRKNIEKVKGRVEGVMEDAAESFEKLGDSFEDRVSKTLQRLGVPTRDEIGKLTKRVEELTAKVDQLRPAKGAAKAAPKPAAKSAARARKTA